MTITITDILKAKLALDKQGVPSEKRQMRMSTEAYMELLSLTKLKAFTEVCGFKVVVDARSY